MSTSAQSSRVKTWYELSVMRPAALFLLLSLTPRLAWADCSSDADCKAGRACQNGVCTARGCSKDTECPGLAICERGACSSLSAPVRRETNTPLAIAGTIVFGVVYLAGIPVTAAIGENAEAAGLMALPIFGPFLVGALEPISNAQGVALGAAAVMQAVGLTLFIVGLATERSVSEPANLGTVSLGEGPASPVLSLSPGAACLRF